MTNRNKVFFHGAGPGIGTMIFNLNDAGVPVTAKSINNEGFALEAANTGQLKSVDNHVIFRMPGVGGPHSDHPDLSLSPIDAAAAHWAVWKAAIPQGIKGHRDLFWIEPVNEVDTHAHAEWLGAFCCEYAKLANADGYRILLAGFNAGQPEPEDWEMYFGDFLEYCADFPYLAGVSLHEGKIGDMTVPADDPMYVPWLIGRYEFLNDACDSMGIDRPTIFISEWAWAYNDLPSDDMVKEDILYLSETVSQVANIEGVCLWNLDPDWGDLSSRMPDFIPFVEDLTLNKIYPDPSEPPPIGVTHTIHLLPQATLLYDTLEIVEDLYETRTAFTYSHDVAYSVAASGTVDSVVVLWSPELWDFDVADWFEQRGILTREETLPSLVDSTPPPDPDPPLPELVSMAQFFVPSSDASKKYGPIVILENNWGEGQERTQLQRGAGDFTYITKNNQWELRGLGRSWIKLLVDTSPGDGNYYTSDGQWMPRHWRIGYNHNDTAKIRFYRKSDCGMIAEYNSTTALHFKALHENYMVGNLRFDLVAEVQWIVNGNVDETYWYARNIGLIRWLKYDGRESKAVSIISSTDQKPNEREEIGCL